MTTQGGEGRDAMDWNAAPDGAEAVMKEEWACQPGQAPPISPVSGSDHRNSTCMVAADSCYHRCDHSIPIQGVYPHHPSALIVGITG